MSLRVAIVGPGALGKAYGAALHRAGCTLTLVGRRPHPAGYHAETVGLFGRRRHIEARTTTQLPEADVLLVAVRAENVTASFVGQLAERATPTLILTPSLAEATVSVWSELPRGFFAMPSLFALSHGNDVRYMAPPLSATLLGNEARAEPKLVELCAALRRGGVRTRFVPEVIATNRATTLAFFPLQQGLATVPSFSKWSGTPGLLESIASAQRACLRFARTLGPVDPGAALLGWVASSPWRLRLMAALFPKLQPFVAGFLEEHFGHKLLTQTALLASGVEDLARARGLSDAECERLLPPGLQAPRLPAAS